MAGPEDVACPFGVDEEKCLVSLDGATDSCGPRVVVLKRTRNAAAIVEKIVRTERPASPVVDGIAVEQVGTRLRVVVDLRASLTAVLSCVTVHHHGHFFYFVRAEEQVTCTRIIEVKERVVVIVAVHRE